MEITVEKTVKIRWLTVVDKVENGGRNEKDEVVVRGGFWSREDEAVVRGGFWSRKDEASYNETC